MKHSSFDATISALDAETSAIGRSYRRYRCGVYGDIGDCRVGITPQMCNRVTNHGDTSTFSKPEGMEVEIFGGLERGTRGQGREGERGLECGRGGRCMIGFLNVQGLTAAKSVEIKKLMMVSEGGDPGVGRDT